MNNILCKKVFYVFIQEMKEVICLLDPVRMTCLAPGLLTRFGTSSLKSTVSVLVNPHLL